MAATEKVTVLDGSVPGKPTAEVRFVESGGAALLPAERALYGRDRHVKDRIRWSFDPTKEEKVSRLLDWIQATSHAVATFGLQKFLESGQRGAIIANAGYRSYMNPQEPAFDWITWPFVVKTLDRTLQQSLAYYDPAAQVLVFVFLLSETGSSIAIWRRRLDVPSSLRITYRKELDRRKAELAKQSLEIITDT
ncbi:hypothetical protein SISNIDRAFT_405519 [Sistotremastrum niveocremeum HHB9708]|nr:hypothetical protein SISNIDRAFT_405519 [Sistotremastrum niveocremeum HHB9708]